MMREVGTDESNGAESTFEFVENKLEGLQLNEDGTVMESNTSGAGNFSNPLPTNPASTSGPSSSTSSYFSTSVPPPADLPTFISTPPSVTKSSSVPPLADLPTFISTPPSVTKSFSPTRDSQTVVQPTPLNPGAAFQGSIPSLPPAPIVPPSSMGIQHSVPPPPIGGHYSSLMSTPSTVGAGVSPLVYTGPLSAPSSIVYSNTPTAPVTYSDGSLPPTILSAQPSSGYSGQPYYPGYGGVSTALDLPMVDVGTDLPHQPLSPSGDGGGLMGWIKGTVSNSDFLTKVAEKAKSSVDTMITTLDPQMKEYIYSGGDVDITVVSDSDIVVAAVREAFQAVFGRATVRGQSAPSQLAPQLVGFTAGLQAAEDRVQYLRANGLIHPNQPTVSLDSCIVELNTDRWYEFTCLVLRDPGMGLNLQSYTQPIPIPTAFVTEAQNATPSSYPLRWSGLDLPVSNLVSRSYGVPSHEWQTVLSGVQTRDLIHLAAKTLATSYRMQYYSNGQRIA